MIELRPFRAWRPARDKAHLVATRSYLTYSAQQLGEKLQGNPYSFLHVIHADHGADHAPRAERFARVRRRFEEFCGEGVFLREERPAFYLYEQSRTGFRSRGIIGAVNVRDYRAGRVRMHEQTLNAREELFRDYLQLTGINAEPVLLAAPDASELDAALDQHWGTPPVYDFSTTDRTRHRFWAITDRGAVKALQQGFAQVETLYIADGHHRCASSARLAEAAGAFADDPRAWCLAFIVPQHDLYIFNFDRAVTTLNGMDTDEFMEALNAVGEMHRLPGAPDAPPLHGTVGVLTRKGWYRLKLPDPPPNAPPDERLDAALLSQHVLGPVLGIRDLRADHHVKFVPGILGTAELERLVSAGEAAAAFHLRPVSFAELRAVADSGGSMPPKSTYIEPKLRSGLSIYSLEEP